MPIPSGLLFEKFESYNPRFLSLQIACDSKAMSVPVASYHGNSQSDWSPDASMQPTSAGARRVRMRHVSSPRTARRIGCFEFARCEGSCFRVIIATAPRSLGAHLPVMTDGAERTAVFHGVPVESKQLSAAIRSIRSCQCLRESRLENWQRQCRRY